MGLLELLFSNKKKELRQTCDSSIKQLDFLEKSMKDRKERVDKWIKENPDKPIPPHIML